MGQTTGLLNWGGAARAAAAASSSEDRGRFSDLFTITEDCPQRVAFPRHKTSRIEYTKNLGVPLRLNTVQLNVGTSLFAIRRWCDTVIKVPPSCVKSSPSGPFSQLTTETLYLIRRGIDCR